MLNNLSELDTYEDRVNEVNRLVSQLPEPNKRMLEVILEHLDNVSLKEGKNMMTVSNLGVCFGPTLLRAEEETVAAIMDIKFGNVVVEILIENWRQILRGEPPRAMPPQSPDGKGAAAARGGQGTPQGSPTRRLSYGEITLPSGNARVLQFFFVVRFTAREEPHANFWCRFDSASSGIWDKPGLSARSDPAADDDLAAPAAYAAASALPEPAAPSGVATDFPLCRVCRGVGCDRSLPRLGGGVGDRGRECGQVGARCDIQQWSQTGNFTLYIFTRTCTYCTIFLVQAMVTNKSPPTHSPPLPPQASNPPSYATWERTHSGSGLAGGRPIPGPGGQHNNQGGHPSNLVAPPLGSAPPVAMRGHTSQMGGSSVHSSMSNLANSTTNLLSTLSQQGGGQQPQPVGGHINAHQKQLSSPPVVTSSDGVDHSWQYRPPNVVQQAKTAVLSRQLSSGGEDGVPGGGGRIYPHVPPRASKAGMGVGMSMGVARSSQGSSSSSIDSLTSGSSSKGMEGVSSAPNSAPPTGIGSHRSPLAAPRTSLTGTSSAPISAQEGGSSSYSSSQNSRE